MSLSNVKPSQTRSVGKSAGNVNAYDGESDLAVFNLRDTLSSITVREANFGEFLAALKKFGAPTSTQV